MSLYINALRKLRERLLDPRHLRSHENDELNEYLEAEDLAEAKRLECAYEYEFIERIDADGLDDPPKSQALYDWGGNCVSIQREFLSYTRKANERNDELKIVDRKIAVVADKLLNSALSLTQKRKLLDEASRLQATRSVLDDPNCGPESINWAETMALSQLSWLQWQYEKTMTEDDRRYIEPPRFPIKCLSDIPLPYDHCSYLFYPDEPSPKRKALIDVIDRLISKG